MGLTQDEIWRRISEHQGEFFQTHQGLWFTYRLAGPAGTELRPSHSDLAIPRADFERVMPLLPLADPRKIAKFVTGYPYVAAVLSDPRISLGDW